MVMWEQIEIAKQGETFKIEKEERIPLWFKIDSSIPHIPITPCISRNHASFSPTMIRIKLSHQISNRQETGGDELICVPIMVVL